MDIDSVLRDVTPAKVTFVFDYYAANKAAHDALVWLHLTRSDFSPNGEDRDDFFTGQCPYGDDTSCLTCSTIARLSDELSPGSSPDFDMLRDIGRVNE